MPYIWTEPNLVLEHQGISVYNTYKDDNCDRPFEFHYTTDITEQSAAFDIRDLECYQYGGEHTSILKQAIEHGEITAPSDEGGVI